MGWLGMCFQNLMLQTPTPPPVNQSCKFNAIADYCLVRQGAGVSMTLILALVLLAPYGKDFNDRMERVKKIKFSIYIIS